MFRLLLLSVCLFGCNCVSTNGDLETIHVQIVEKTKVNAIRNIGCGSLLETVKGRTYVLTAKHLFENEKTSSYYIREDLQSDLKLLKVSAFHDEYDMAIVDYKADSRIRAHKTRVDYSGVKMREPVIFVGSPHGIHMETKIGYVTPYKSGIKHLYRINSPGNFGYSGGGVFRGDKLIGVTSMVTTETVLKLILSPRKVMRMESNPTGDLFIDVKYFKSWIHSVIR